jgi:undecaprenyl-diphosphatase
MRRTPTPSALLAISALALLGFGYTARLVAGRRTVSVDDRARDDVQAVREPAGELAAQAAGPLGKEYLHFPAAFALALYLRRRGVGWRATVPVMASVASELMNRLVTHTLHIRVVPPGHPEHHTRKPSFPSGHAMETTAVAAASAYVLTREQLAPPAAAVAVAGTLATASVFSRLYLDRHWASDALGGTLLGVAVAAACGAAYEALPATAPRRLGPQVRRLRAHAR